MEGNLQTDREDWHCFIYQVSHIYNNLNNQYLLHNKCYMGLTPNEQCYVFKLIHFPTLLSRRLITSSRVI